MPFTMNGVGTHYYGRTEPHQDGSYITTEWITFFIPIIPRKSYRLRPAGKLDWNVNRKSQQYEVLEQFPALYSKQVRHVYKGVVVCLIFFAIALYLLIDIGFVHDNGWGFIIFLLTFFVSDLVFGFWVDRFTK